MARWLGRRPAAIDRPDVVYDMNAPHDMSNEALVALDTAYILGVRQVRWNAAVIIPVNDWSGRTSWRDDHA